MRAARHLRCSGLRSSGCGGVGVVCVAVTFSVFVIVWMLYRQTLMVSFAESKLRNYCIVVRGVLVLWLRLSVITMVGGGESVK